LCCIVFCSLSFFQREPRFLLAYRSTSVQRPLDAGWRAGSSIGSFRKKLFSILPPPPCLLEMPPSSSSHAGWPR
jgi:hypothetical protein